MGREIRRVPPRWEHPKRQVANHRLGRLEEGYQPLYDDDFETAMLEWLNALTEWLATGFAEWRQEHPDDERRDEPYRAFCEWESGPPDPDSYRSPWKEEPTWFQVYETVSEGTPVTPPFATKEELVDYLATHGDFWDQARRAEGRGSIRCDPWARDAAERFVNAGWAPSMIVTNTAGAVDIKEPRDGI